MKRVYALIVPLAAAAVILLVYIGARRSGPGAVSVPSSSNILYNSTANVPSSQESSAVGAMTSEADYYTVKEYNGRIGVFFKDEPTPYEEINVDVSLLPEADRALLKAGIRADSMEKLNSILEDYES